jgi:hypothetical protein
VSSKVATYVWNTFYSKIMRWQKVSHEDKKNWKSANLPKCTDPLNLMKQLLLFSTYHKRKWPFNQLAIIFEPMSDKKIKIHFLIWITDFKNACKNLKAKVPVIRVWALRGLYLYLGFNIYPCTTLLLLYRPYYLKTHYVC